MKYIEFDESRPMDLVLLGRVAIDFKPCLQRSGEGGVQTPEEGTYV